MPIPTPRAARTDWNRRGSRVPVLRRAVAAIVVFGALGGAGSAATYVVRPGDTLSSIASRVGVDVADLARSNAIADPNRVYAGQTLTVPGGQSAPAATAARTHVVASGETLSSIAGRYRTTIRALVDANGIPDPNHVRVGTRLLVPGAAAAPSSSSSGSTPTTGLPPRLLESPARLALIPHFKRWAAANGLDPALVMAVAWHESGWQNSVVSPVGARGIGQLMPGTARFVSEELIGVALDPNVPADNIRMMARYLRFLLGRVGGDERLALAGYFQGPGSVAARGLLAVSEQYVHVVQQLRPRFAGV